MRSDVAYRLSIVNLSKPDSLYTCGMKPGTVFPPPLKNEI